jgi:hypothetical protein
MNRILATAAVAMLAVMAPLGRAERTAEKNKAVVRRVFTEILSQGKFEAGAEIYGIGGVAGQRSRLAFSVS